MAKGTVSHTLHDCYNAVRKAARTSNGANIQFAANYAQYGLNLPDAVSAEECTLAARVQAQYVRANISGWRGEEAQAVRRSLDKIIGKD